MGQTFCLCLRTPVSNDDLNALPQTENLPVHLGNSVALEEYLPDLQVEKSLVVKENPPARVENSLIYEVKHPVQLESCLDAEGNLLPQVGNSSVVNVKENPPLRENSLNVEENATAQVENSLDAEEKHSPQTGDSNHLDEGSSLEIANLISQGEDLNHFEEISLTKLLEVNDRNHLDEVISFIEARLAAIHTEKTKECISGAETSTSSDNLSSTFYCGYIFLGKVIKRAQTDSSKILSSEIRKTVIDLLKEVSQIHWIVAGLGVVAYALDQMEKVSINKRECIEFLSYMCGLAKQIKQLDNHLNKEKLRDAVVFIVHGSFFCISRMQSNYFSRFFSASMDAQELKNLQSKLNYTLSYLTLHADIQILNRMNTMFSPTKAEDPKAVGIDEARDEVVKLLDLKDPSTRSVVLYGLGGIGKTTLATAVLSSIDITKYNYCRVNVQHDGSESHIQRLQQQVLRDLFEKRAQLRDDEEGRSQLLKLFSEETCKPVFLFIDNASSEKDLIKLLPEKISCRPNGSRLLITIRNGASMIEWEDVKRCSYRVKSLSDAASRNLLRRKALGGADNVFNKSLNIDGLVKICGGVPLVLNFAGSKLHKLGNDVRACESTIECLKDILLTGEGNLSKKVVDVVYSDWEEVLHNDAFLDIATFFNEWDERMVGYIVGVAALEAIKDAALVTIEKGKVLVEDIVKARGRKLSEDDRITDHRSLRRVLCDKKKLRKLKGIWLPPPENSREFQLESNHLLLMEKSVRVLHLSERNNLDGTSMSTFTNLRLLHINGDFRMELEKHENLSVLQAYLKKCDGLADSSRLLNFPGSVYHLKLSGFKLSVISENFSNLSRIEELHLSSSSGSLTDSFCHLKSLRFLEIIDCPELISLPIDFGKLSKLETLNLSGSALTNLPDSFGQLSGLEELNISKCKKLMEFPKSFTNLRRLKKLNISHCEQLSRLPDGFDQLKVLTHLDMSGCSSLEMLSQDFEQLSSVCAVNASNCPRLHGNASVSIDENRGKHVDDTEFSFLLSGNGGAKIEQGISGYPVC